MTNMTNMNSTQKNQNRYFNIIDVVIIVLVIAAVAFAANFVRNDMFSKEVQDVKYALKISGADTSNISKITVGDMISTTSAGTTLGTVTAISTAPQKKLLFDSEANRFVYTEVPGKNVITVTVTASCTKTNNMYLIGDNIISANTSPDVILPFRFESAEIISVSVLPKVSAKISEEPEAEPAD